MATKLRNELTLSELEVEALDEVGRLLDVQGDAMLVLVEDARVLKNYELTEQSIKDFGPRQTATERIKQLQEKIEEIRLEAKKLEAERNDLHFRVLNIGTMTAELTRIRNENPRLFD